MNNKPPEKKSSRRDALKKIGLATGAALAGVGLQGSDPARANQGKRPNIIFILSDDHRWDHLSCLDHPFIQTPRLDRLAKDGVLFTNAFVTTSLCSPSRASFLTGKYAHTHGVKNNMTPWNNQNVTFFESLKKLGYDTAFIGKWHMPGKLPQLRGVDKFATFTVQAGQGRYFDCPIIEDGIERPSRKSYITEELTDMALDFVTKQRDNPFCLFLAHKAVHHQFLPPPETKGMYKDVKLDLPKEMDQWISNTNGNMFYGTMGPMTYHYRNYCEAITALDSQIGRVLDKVDEMGIAEDTMVVYAGDNGYFWGEHRLVDKRWAYEESIRVPFIVRYPRLIPDPGRRADQMITNVDLAPSIFDTAGIQIPRDMQGASFKPILEDASTPGRTAWLYEYFRDYPANVPQHFAVRTKKLKYIEYDDRHETELFNLLHDPKEKNNLIGTAEGDKLARALKVTLRELKEGLM